MPLLESRANPFRVWIDIENPPQVQYLLPFRQAFEAAGLETVITARDYGSTVRMLETAGVPANVYGVRVGRGKLRKAAATARRAYDLQSFLTQTGKPGAVLTASRSAAVAAWRLGIPSFVILDYEHVFVRVCRYTNSTVIFPDVIAPAAFVRKGLRPRQLLPVKGI